MHATVIFLPSYQRPRPSPAPRCVFLMWFGRCTAMSESLVAWIFSPVFIAISSTAKFWTVKLFSPAR